MTDDNHEFLTFNIGEQMFGVPVLQVNDVLAPQRITRAPLAPPAIAGIMNLRGRIVTAIDVRNCLGQPRPDSGETGMGVVIERNSELFSLIIDRVGDVLSLPAASLEDIPPTLDGAWRAVASCIHKLENELLVILDTDRLLEAAKS